MALFCQHAIDPHPCLAVDLKYSWWWLIEAQGISHINKRRTSWRKFIVMTINHSDSDEFHVEIKENVVEEGEDSEVVVAPKTEKRKKTIAYNSDDESDDANPESMSKLNKIVFLRRYR